MNANNTQVNVGTVTDTYGWKLELKEMEIV